MGNIRNILLDIPVMDRDVNAANNMVNYYHSQAQYFNFPSSTTLSYVTASSPEILTAFGEDISPSITRCSSVNQE